MRVTVWGMYPRGTGTHTARAVAHSVMGTDEMAQSGVNTVSAHTALGLVRPVVDWYFLRPLIVFMVVDRLVLRSPSNATATATALPPTGPPPPPPSLLAASSHHRVRDGHHARYG